MFFQAAQAQRFTEGFQPLPKTGAWADSIQQGAGYFVINPIDKLPQELLKIN